MITDHRRALLDAMLRAEGLDAPGEEVTPEPRTSGIPLSFAQESVWAAEQLRPGTAAYHVPLLIRLRGPLDAGALGRAVEWTINRRDALRVTFDVQDGVASQRVADPLAGFRLTVVEPDGANCEQRREAVGTRALADLLVPFDLTAGPLYRVLLYRIAADEHMLLLVCHHLIADGWSVALLLDDVAAAYGRLVNTGTVPDVAAPPSFAAHAAGHQQAREAGRCEASMAYWTERLDGYRVPAHDFEPVLKNRTPVSIRQPLDVELAEAVRDWARREQTTAFAVYLSAFAAWASASTGRDDLVIAVPCNLRRGRREDATVGMFVQSMPLRIRVDPTAPARTLVRAIGTAIIDAGQHAAISLPGLLARLALMRASRPPVEFACAYESRRPLPRFGELVADLAPFEPPLAKSALAVTFIDTDGIVTTRTEGDGSWWGDEVAANVVGQLSRVVRELIADPGRPVSQALTAAGICRFTTAEPTTNLTPLQQLMWLGQLRYPETPIYNVACALRIRCELKAEAMARAFERLVDAHDALRATMATEYGVPRLIVRDQARARLRMATEALDETTIDDWLQREATGAFEAGGPLTRAVLARVGPADFLLVTVQHHVITDGWSVRLIGERLSELYQQETDDSAVIAERPTTFVSALNARRPGEADPAWIAHLDGLEPLQMLASAGRRGTAVVRTPMAVPDGVAAALSARTGAQGRIDRFTAFATALLAWMHRLTGRRRVSLGAPYHNRRSRDQRRTPGLMMDVLPMVVDVTPDETFASLAGKVRDAWAEAVAHAGSPLPASIRAGACDVLLNYQTMLPERLFDTDVQPAWIYTGHELEALAVQVHEWQGGFVVHVDGHADEFDAPLRDVTGRQLARLLEATVGTPAERVADVALVSAAEQALIESAARGPNRPRPAALLDAVRARVDATPDAIAIEAGAVRVSYDQLWTRAAAVAAGLQAHGCGAGDVVGIWMQRSPDQIAAALGVWMAGAAYAPLDAEWPEARARELAARADARLCISDSSAASIADVQVTVARLAEHPLRQGAGVPATSSDALAYVIYTSGSTGDPKGVEITHGALGNYIAYAADLFGITPGDRLLQFASLAFDTAAEEIFPTLVCGATLVLRDAGHLESPAAFLEACGRRGVTVLDLPTAFWHALVEAARDTMALVPPSLRLVVVGGDALRADRLAQWQTWTRGRIRLLNGYGPTEGTIVSTFADLTDAGADRAGVIGRPVWNAEAWVLDSARQPAAPWVPGELYVGGAGLARGYRGEPARTAERFVGLSRAAGARVYRTGDRARWRADGELEFLGRLDDQVKVRGVRVEPGEIERVLQQHPAVADAAVVSVGTEGGVRLIAHVVRRAETTEADLRASVGRALPEAMVPAAVVFHGALPRTAGGKIDRHRLRSQAAPVAAVGRLPQGDTEAWLACTWSELLGRDVQDANASFFALGGHSLSAVRLSVRIEATFGVRLPIARLFEHPTIETLARDIDAARPEPPPADAIVALLDRIEAMSEGDVLARLTSDAPAPAGEQA